MLSIEDMKQIVKHYAFQLQKRIEQLDQVCFPYKVSRTIIQQEEIVPPIYQDYLTNNPTEIKLIGRLIERTLQIYQFFKKKSKNQNLLTVIQTRISSQLNQFQNKIPLDVGAIVNYIQKITKKGQVIRVPVNSRRTFSKSVFKAAEQKIIKYKVPHLEKRSPSVVTTIRCKNNSIISDKNKTQFDINLLYGGIEFDKFYIQKITDNNQINVIQEMIKKNAKIHFAIKQYQKIYYKGDVKSAALNQINTINSNYFANVFNRKRKQFVRKRTFLKQNLFGNDRGIYQKLRLTQTKCIGSKSQVLDRE